MSLDVAIVAGSSISKRLSLIRLILSNGRSRTAVFGGLGPLTDAEG